MACRSIKLPRGATAIVCGPRVRRPLRRCIVCGCPETWVSMRLCDGPALRGPGTCDRPVCVDCAYHVEPDTDYCPQHVPDVPGRVS